MGIPRSLLMSSGAATLILFYRRPPDSAALAPSWINTQPDVVVALRTQDRREAALRAPRLGVLFEVGSRMGL